MPIDFNTLPQTLRIPINAVEFDASQALVGFQGIYQNVLIIGQKLSTGTQTAGEVCLVPSDAMAEEKFGRGSMLAQMCKSCRANNPYLPIYAVALADAGAGVAATGSIALTGPATAAGTLNLYVAGQRVRVAVEDAETAANVATALAAAINAATDLPVTASANSGTVTVTARHKGICGNYIDLRLNYLYDEATPAGLAATITAMHSGAGNPDITSALTTLGQTNYWHIISAYTDSANVTALWSEIEDRWAWDEQRYVIGYLAYPGTQGEMATFGNSENGQFMSILGAGKSPTPPWIVAAMYGGAASYYLSNDPARPLQTIKIKGMLPPALADRLGATNRDALLHDGISTYVVGQDGYCYIETAITNYQVDGLGTEDASWLYLNIPAILAQYAYGQRALLARTYPRHKLADDTAQVAPGQAIARPKDIKSTLISYYKGIAQNQGWVENVEGYKKALIVERDATDRNRVNYLDTPFLIGQLMRTFGRVQFRLNAGTE